VTNEQQSSWIKIALDWLAAVLGIGTVAGLVNIGVGLLSSLWIACQVYGWFKYDRPIKKAQAKAAQREMLANATKPSEL